MKISEPQIPFSVQKMTEEEVKLLRKKMIVTWIAGFIITGVSTFIIVFNISNFAQLKIPMIIFGTFFYSVLIFILFNVTRNAFRTEKRIYSGTITDKKTETQSKMRSNVGSSNTYRSENYIALNNNWFYVPQEFFNKVHQGDLVDLYTFKDNIVFNIEIVKKNTEIAAEQLFKNRQRKKMESVFSGMNEQLTAGDKTILKRNLATTIFRRTVIGFFIFLALEYIANFLIIVFLFSIIKIELNIYVFVHYLNLLIFISLFLLYNRKTFRIFLDLRSGEKEIVVEQIVDLISSNQIKKGPNVTLIKGYNDGKQLYYYLQTDAHWLETDEATFNSSFAGNEVKISQSIRSKILLDVEY